MNKNTKFYFQTVLALICFLIIFYVLKEQVERYVLCLFLLPISLLFPREYKYSVSVFGMTAVIISVITFGLSYLTLIISLIFISVIPSLNYFFKPNQIQSPDLKKKNDELRFFKEELLNEDRSLNEERLSLEKKLEKIIQLYIISKDLTKNITAEESSNALSAMLSSRTGIIYSLVAVKYRAKNHLTILSSIKHDIKNKWDAALKENYQEIINLSKPSIVTSLSYIENKPVIAWPIILDNNFISCAFLIVERNYAQTYLEEGSLFIPHLILGTKRIILFSALQEKARVDGLTGLYLRRHFMERLYTEFQRSKRYKTDFYILMLDIDFFKKINDTYGHLIGDKVLVAVAKILSKSVRPGDLIGRYGGEEFIVLLPMASQEQVTAIAENIRSTVQKTRFNENNFTFSVTISIGIAKYRNNTTSNDVISLADKALYDAKQTGRNKIILND
ncbi:MAG: GGDEF domain-containing protein [Endomicrobiaceae bacterium]